jgi:hypothetical protein
MRLREKVRSKGRKVEEVRGSEKREEKKVLVELRKKRRDLKVV